jgi:hypothetical protein
MFELFVRDKGNPGGGVISRLVGKRKGMPDKFPKAVRESIKNPAAASTGFCQNGVNKVELV